MNEIIIEVKNISKVYDEMTDNPVISLNNISMSIEKGEFICVMGTSGSGKTTFINCISTMDTPSKGQVILFGKSTLEMSDEEIGNFRSKEIGFIFQEYNLLDYLTLEENIAFPLSMNKVKNSEIKKRVHEIAKNLGIEGLLNKYPDECSGGQKQRTAIADEPTGNLDSKNTSELLAILKNLNEKEGKTIIMVTHDVMVGSFASRLLYIQDGTIKEQLSRKEFKTQEDYFYNISKINSKEQLISLKK